MEMLDYFVLILVFLAYVGWFLARNTDPRSRDTRSEDTQPRI